MAKKKRRTGSSVNVNLSEVESTRKVLPEGEYVVSVNDASVEQSNQGNDYIKFEFEVIEGEHKKAKLFHNCSLQPQALFNLKNVLEALGFEIPKKAFDLELSNLLGLECEVVVGHEVYDGKKKARIIEFINPSDEEDEDDEDEDDEEDLAEALENLSKRDLKAIAKEYEIEVSKDSSSKEIIEDLMDEVEEEDLWEALENPPF